MSEKSFDEKLKEREAEIRKIWASQSKAKAVAPTSDAHISEASPASIKRDMEQELTELKKLAKEEVPTGVRTMTESDYAGLLEKIKTEFAKHGIPSDGIWLQLSSPKWWAVSLFLPYKGLEMKKVGSTIEKLLIADIGVDKYSIDYFGRNPKIKAHEWYFMPPGLPNDIKNAVDAAGDYDMQRAANDELGLGIPVPNKSKDTKKLPLLVLPESLYRQIESGEKKTEYRNLVTHYCDKFFGSGKMIRAVIFQLGYQGKDGGKPEQMAWEVKNILLVSEHGKMAPAVTNGKMTTFKDLSKVFPPVAYAIQLGKRLEALDGSCATSDSQHDTIVEVGDYEEEIQLLIDGIKAGRLKSKTPDGYLVLKGEFYDAIASGKKKIEYRDFSEYNLKRTIGLKTVRFNRGYVKNAPQMKWEVKKVVLLDCEDNESEPFNVPDGFCPTTIAIHLGKRLS